MISLNFEVKTLKNSEKCEIFDDFYLNGENDEKYEVYDKNANETEEDVRINFKREH